MKALLLAGPETCLADALSHIPAVRDLTRYPKAGATGGGWEDALGSGGGEAAQQAGARIRTLAREVNLRFGDILPLSHKSAPLNHYLFEILSLVLF